MQSKVDLLLEVVKDRTEALIKRYQGLDLNLYVPITGYCRDSREKFYLEKGVDNLLQNLTSKVLLLTGHSGSGKTSFGQVLIRKKWESCGIINRNSSANEIFLWIPLLSIKNPEDDLIKKHLRHNLRLTELETNLVLTSDYSFLCVLDGYDELHTDKNLLIANELHELPGKIIFTCRDENLRADYRQRFMSPNTAQGFSEYRLLPFDELQKENYLLRYIKQNRTKWDLDTYKSKLASIPELNNLVSNPFLLSITVKVLPEILLNHTQVNETHRIVLTRHGIYQAFIDQWFERQKNKLLKKDQEIKPLLENSSYVKKLIHSYGTTEIKRLLPPCLIIKTEQGHKGLSYAELFARFTERLARTMFKHQVTEITYIPGKSSQSITNSKAKTFNWQGSFLEMSHDPVLEILLNAAPLIPVGISKHCFIHPSVLEFFAAKHLFNGALLYSWVIGEHNLNVSGLLEQPAILKMLAERVHSKPEFAEALWEIIKTSCSEPSVWRAAANAITILNRAGVSFSGKNLRNIRIGGVDGDRRWGADLSRGVMDGVDFGDADLRYVNFTNAWISNALFDGACTDGTDFGEQPWLEYQISPNAKNIYTSPDGKWLAVEESYAIQLYKVTERAVILEYQIILNEKSIELINLGNQWIAVLYKKEDSFDLFNLISGKRVDTSSRKVHPTDHYYADDRRNRRDITFSNDGRYLGIIGKFNEDAGIYLWTINEFGKMDEAIFLPSSERVMCLAFSLDNQYIFIGDGDGIAVWDNTSEIPRKIRSRKYTDKEIFEICDAENFEMKMYGENFGIDGMQQMHGSECFRIEFDNSRNKIALVCPYEINIYDWNQKPQTYSFNHNERMVNAKFSPCGRWIAAFGEETSDISLWNLNSRQLEYVLAGHKKQIIDIFFDSTKNQLISYGRDNTIRFWSLTGEYLKNYKAVKNHGKINSIAVNANGLWLSSICRNNIVQVREILSGKLLEKLPAKKRGIGEMVFNPVKNEEIIYQDITGMLYRQNLLTKATDAILIIEKNFFAKKGCYLGNKKRFALNQTGEKIVSCCWTSFFSLWESSSNQVTVFELTDLIPKKDIKITSIAFHPHEEVVALGVQCGPILLANLVNNNLKPTLGKISSLDILKFSTPTSLSFHPKGQYLAGAGSQAIVIWDIQSVNLITTIPQQGPFIRKVAFSPCGEYLASRQSHTIVLWESRGWTCIHTIKANVSLLQDFAWSNKIDEIGILYLATASHDSLKMWKLDSTGPVLKSQLIWRTDNGLDCNSIHMKKVTGLSEANYNLLSQHSLNTIEGRPSEKQSLALLKERNEQKYVPQGKIAFNSQNKHFTLDQQNWIISLVREKKPCLEISQNHTWLLIQGIDENNYTVTKELHFYRNTHAASCLGLVGKGTVSIKDRSLWDLNYQVKEGNLLSRTWHLTKDKAEKLIREAGEQATRGYIVSGKTPTMFGASYLNCLSWCLEQLRSLGISNIPLHGNKSSMLSQFLDTLSDFVVAIPERYLPEQEEEVDEFNTTCTFF